MDVESIQTTTLVNEKQKPKRSQSSMQWALLGLALAMGVVALGLAGWAAHKANKQQRHINLVAGKRVAVVAEGGQKVDGYTNEGHLFAGTGYWARETDMLHQRSDHQVVAVGTDIYLIGGLSNRTAPPAASLTPKLTGPVALDSLVKYDTYSGDMMEMAKMPEPRYRFGAALLNNRIYITGGFNEFENNTVVSIGTTMVYDIASAAWLPPNTVGSLNVPRSDLCCYAAAGKVYCAGGWKSGDYSEAVAIVEELDPATGKWTQIADMSTKRGDCKCASINDRFYVMGGVTVAKPAGVDCNDFANYIACNPFTASVERYDPASKKWEKRADMIHARGDFAADPLPNGRIFVMGGEMTNGTKNQFAMHYTEQYVEEDDVWVPKAPLPEARFRFDAGHVKDRVYVFGGHPTCFDMGAPLADLCYENGLQSVYGFFDIQYPNVYVMVKNK